MYRIIDGRGTGKTSRLLLLAKENNGIVVCANPQAMREKAYRYGITGIDFLSYGEFAHNQIPCRPIFIDEIDSFLNSISNAKIQGYTISNED